MERDLEHDLTSLADRARSDRGFAVELYGALCNADWRHDDGTEWRGGTWRYVGQLVADLRGRGEDDLDFYCSGGEGEITDRVAEAMAALGWYGVGHGARLRAVDLISGRVEILDDNGEWVVESVGEIADSGPAEDWASPADDDPV